MHYEFQYGGSEGLRLRRIKAFEALRAAKFHFDALGGRRSPSYRAPAGRGTCWVIQWILPPPSSTSRVGTPTTVRVGNKRFRTRIACASLRSPYSGITTLLLAM